jgi:general secretion pathway protein G
MSTAPQTTPSAPPAPPPAGAAPRRAQWGVRLALLAAISGGTALAWGAVKMREHNIEETKSDPAQRARMDILFLESRVRYYTRVVGRPPLPEAGFKEMVAAGMLRGVPSDPWGREYVYSTDGNKASVLSLGRDGKEGGEGEDADVVSLSRDP